MKNKNGNKFEERLQKTIDKVVNEAHSFKNHKLTGNVVVKIHFNQGMIAKSAIDKEDILIKFD